MSLNLLFRFFCLSFSVLLLTKVSAVNGADFSAELAFEGRYFFDQGSDNKDKFHSSIFAEAEYQKSFDSDDFNVVLFGRLDQHDAERTHADIREAYWTHISDDWEMKVGVSKVFWGVTESRHLVDIINQTDLVESIDAEEKLGQPMVKFAVERDWGNLDIFWLPYFRERTFVGKDGRLNPLPFNVDNDKARYESSAKQWRSDFAIRYAVMFDDLDLAISHFSGTSRNPLFVSNNSLSHPMLIPVYKQIDQTGLELQYIYEDWLWKLEAITSSGENQRYTAAVFGFEYTQVGILETAADLGWIVEYLFDDRRNHSNGSAKAALHSFERDVFLGWRYAMNNADSTELLAGLIYDPKTEEMFYSAEFSHRMAHDIKLNMELRIFQGAENDSSLKTYYMRDEDYIQFELVKFF